MTGSNSGVGPERIERISDLVCAYVSNNHIAPGDLPALIGSVHAAVSGLTVGGNAAQAKDPADKPTAGQVRRSVTPNGIVSFLDGRAYKTLKRHLTKHGLDPQSYRERYGLPADYPMVATAYSEKRSSLAKSLGLGQHGGRAAPGGEVEPVRKGPKKAV